MDKIKSSIFFKSTSLLLIFTFISLDISYAYPPDHNSGNSNLSVPSLFQSRPMTEGAAKLRDSILSQSSVVASIHDIGEYFFGRPDAGIGALPSERAEEVVMAGLGKALNASGVEILNIVPVEYLKKTVPDKLKSALNEIGFKGDLPAEGVVFVLYRKDGKKFLLQIARKDRISAASLPGYEWTVSDKYLVKYLPENYPGAAVAEAGTKKEPAKPDALIEARKIAGFLTLRDPLPKKANLLMAFGNEYLQTVFEAARLYHEGRADAVMLVGGLGHSTANLVKPASEYLKKDPSEFEILSPVTNKKEFLPEARIMKMVFVAKMRELGHSDAEIGSMPVYLEDQSKNCGENVTKASLRIEELNKTAVAEGRQLIKVDSVIIIQQPPLSMRMDRTFRRWQPETIFKETKSICNHAAFIPGDKYLADTEYQYGLLREAQNLENYPAVKYTVPLQADGAEPGKLPQYVRTAVDSLEELLGLRIRIHSNGKPVANLITYKGSTQTDMSVPVHVEKNSFKEAASFTNFSAEGTRQTVLYLKTGAATVRVKPRNASPHEISIVAGDIITLFADSDVFFTAGSSEYIAFRQTAVPFGLPSAAGTPVDLAQLINREPGSGATRAIPDKSGKETVAESYRGQDGKLEAVIHRAGMFLPEGMSMMTPDGAAIGVGVKKMTTPEKTHRHEKDGASKQEMVLCMDGHVKARVADRNGKGTKTVEFGKNELLMYEPNSVHGIDDVNAAVAVIIQDPIRGKDPSEKQLVDTEEPAEAVQREGMPDAAEFQAKPEPPSAAAHAAPLAGVSAEKPVYTQASALDAYDRTHYRWDGKYWRSIEHPRLVLGTREDVRQSTREGDPPTAMENHIAIRTGEGYTIYVFDDHSYSDEYLDEAVARGEIAPTGNNQVFIDDHMDTKHGIGEANASIAYDIIRKGLVGNHTWVYFDGSAWGRGGNIHGPDRNLAGLGVVNERTHNSRYFDVASRPLDAKVIFNIETDAAGSAEIANFVRDVVGRDNVMPSTVHICTSPPNRTRDQTYGTWELDGLDYLDGFGTVAICTDLAGRLPEIFARSRKSAYKGPDMETPGLNARYAAARKKITIVTANYNNERHTAAFLNSLRSLDYPDYEVVIVDDGSEKPFRFDPEAFKGLPAVTVIRSRKNEGISKARNLGIAYALDRGCDYIYFADNDTVLPANLLDVMEREAGKRPDVGIFGGQEYFYREPGRFYSAGGSRILWFPRGYGKPDRGQFSSPREVSSLGSAAILVRREVFDKIGGFDNNLFFGLEDVDFCLKAGLAGFRIMVNPQAKVLHNVGGGLRRFGRERIYYVTRNPLIMAGRFSGILRLKLVLRALLVSVRSAAGIIRSGDMGAFREIFRAFVEGVKGAISGMEDRKIDSSSLSAPGISVERHENRLRSRGDVIAAAHPSPAAPNTPNSTKPELIEADLVENGGIIAPKEEILERKVSFVRQVHGRPLNDELPLGERYQTRKRLTEGVLFKWAPGSMVRNIPESLNLLIDTLVRDMVSWRVEEGIEYDAAKLKQEVVGASFMFALKEVLTNAFDAYARADGEGPIRLRVYKDVEKKSLVFEVSDDGIGIDIAIDTPDNFFVKSNPSPKAEIPRLEGGKGIGLKWTKIAVALHGGSLEILRDRYKGYKTTIRITLPSDSVDIHTVAEADPKSSAAVILAEIPPKQETESRGKALEISALRQPPPSAPQASADPIISSVMKELKRRQDIGHAELFDLVYANVPADMSDLRSALDRLKSLSRSSTVTADAISAAIVSAERIHRLSKDHIRILWLALTGPGQGAGAVDRQKRLSDSIKWYIDRYRIERISQDDDHEFTQFFSGLGVDAGPVLIGLYHQYYGTDRAIVLKALGVTGYQGSADLLLEALRDSDDFVRSEAANTFGRLKNPAGSEALMKALADSSSMVREAAAYALGKLKERRAVERLIKTLKDKIVGVPAAAAWALGEIGDVGSVEPLIEALEHGSGFVGGPAARALGKIKDPRAVEPLIKAFGVYVSPGWSERLVDIADALGELDDVRAVEPLFRGAAERPPMISSDVRNAAGKALIKIVKSRGSRALEGIEASLIREIIMSVLYDDHAYYLKDVLVAVGAPAVPELLAALEDRRDHMYGVSGKRSRAASILGKIGDPRAVEPLKMAFYRGDIYALEILKEMGPVADSALAQIAERSRVLMRETGAAAYASEDMKEATREDLAIRLIYWSRGVYSTVDPRWRVAEQVRLIEELGFFLRDRRIVPMLVRILANDSERDRLISDSGTSDEFSLPVSDAIVRVLRLFKSDELIRKALRIYEIRMENSAREIERSNMGTHHRAGADSPYIERWPYYDPQDGSEGGKSEERKLVDEILRADKDREYPLYGASVEERFKAQAAGTAKSPAGKTPSGTGRLFDIVEEACVNNKARIVRAANTAISALESEGLLMPADGVVAMKREDSAAEVEQLAGRLIAAADRIGEDKLPADVKEAIAEVRSGIGRLEADSIVANVIALARRARHENQNLIIGLDTGWIPGMDETGYGTQRDAIGPVITEIESLGDALRSLGLANVTVIHKNGADLADAILAERRKTGTKFSNIVVLASRAALASERFAELRSTDNEERAFLAAVDPAEIEAYMAVHPGRESAGRLNIEFLKMLSIALDLASGKEPPQMPLILSYDRRLRIVTFLPKAEPADYETIRERYKAEREALSAA